MLITNLMDELTHDIELLKTWAANNPVVERIWIFGSRVRGTHEVDSDLDVAVQHGISPGDSSLFTTSLCAPSEWQQHLQPSARLKLDLQSYIPNETPTVEAGLRKSSKLIYERVA